MGESQVIIVLTLSWSRNVVLKSVSILRDKKGGTRGEGDIDAVSVDR